MNEITWPVAVLAVVMLVAGAIVGQALHTAAGGAAPQAQSLVMAGGARP